MAAAAVLSVSAAASAESAGAAGSGVWTAIAGETSTSYDNLFDVILNEKYSDICYKYCAAAMGEDNAEAAAASRRSGKIAKQSCKIIFCNFESSLPKKF